MNQNATNQQKNLGVAEIHISISQYLAHPNAQAEYMLMAILLYDQKGQGGILGSV